MSLVFEREALIDELLGFNFTAQTETTGRMLNDVREEMICAMCIPDFVEMNRALVSTLHGACVVLVFVEGTTRTTAALRDQMAVFKDTLIRATVHALEPPMQDDCHAAFTAQLAHVG